MSTFWPSMRSSSPPIANAATSSPTGCLRARGASETMFLRRGYHPAAPESVWCPNAEVITRPRFSTLSYAEPSKVTRLPKRSAVVAFYGADVYAFAELIRRQRGRGRGGAGIAQPEDEKRPGRALSGWRGRLSGGDRRHRHGAEHGSRPCGARQHRQIRRA